jgi:hypothetical protein
MVFMAPSGLFGLLGRFLRRSKPAHKGDDAGPGFQPNAVNKAGVQQ